METLCIQDVYKSYGEVSVLKGINISVKKGEFISLLGPSGCGKTTLLRIIAGLTDATEGKILVEGNDVGKLPPFKRNNGMVFQNYALFPHMTVYENIAFGLKMRHLPKKEVRDRVQQGLSMIHLEDLGARYPKELSGGQQQRVALVRALVLNPTLLLLDEPLCNLDAKLRKEMRIEIRKLQQKLKVTTIFVTHDQEEALSMSDRIAVMNAGRLEQVGTPSDLYEHPHTRFVAGFIGNTNLLSCRSSGNSEGFLSLLYGDCPIQVSVPSMTPFPQGEILFSVRPEKIFLSPPDVSGVNRIPCRIMTKAYLGPMIRVIMQDPQGHEITADVSSNSDAALFREGESVSACWETESGQIIAE